MREKITGRREADEVERSLSGQKILREGIIQVYQDGEIDIAAFHVEGMTIDDLWELAENRVIEAARTILRSRRRRSVARPPIHMVRCALEAKP